MRLSALAIVALSLIGALTARLWFLTAVEGEASVQTARENSIRTIHIQAPRGRIYDRNRNVLVDNRQVSQLRVDTKALDEAAEFEDDARAEIYGRIAELLNGYAVPVDPKDAATAAEVAAEDAGEDPDAAADAAMATAEDARWNVGVVEAALENNFLGAFVPTPLASDVPEDLEVLVAENQMLYPGVDVDRIAVRRYPHGSLAAHALGYVGRITQEDLETDAVIDSDKPYAATDEIGRTGVEASYEPWLRGEPGVRVLEVDADNNVVRQVRYRAPTPGMEVMLTLDIQVQTLLETQLAATAEANASPGAAAVVEDPRNGAIIAMASYPTYNPQDFIDGISDEEYAMLTDEENGNRLSNKVISGVYAPGSTFKPVTALAGLRSGLVTPGDTFNDDGVYEVVGCEDQPSCQFQNAGETANGTVDLQRSLTVSSDWYYYRIGDNLWGNKDSLGESYLQDTAVDWGFTEDTGIDLPQEQNGFAYTPERIAELHEENPAAYPFGDWHTGNTVNMAIGQGDLGVTPMQLANMYAALANGGTLYRPHVGMATLRPVPGTWQEDPGTPCVANDGTVDEGALCTVDPTQVGAVEIPSRWRDPMIAGLLGVAQSSQGGTSGPAFDGFDLAGFPIAGKTGTAQVYGKGDSALYVGIGPVRAGQNPEYVIAVIYEDVDQFGGEVAAPVARAVFDGLSNQVPLPLVETVPATPEPSLDVQTETDP